MFRVHGLLSYRQIQPILTIGYPDRFTQEKVNKPLMQSGQLVDPLVKEVLPTHVSLQDLQEACPVLSCALVGSICVLELISVLGFRDWIKNGPGKVWGNIHHMMIALSWPGTSQQGTVHILQMSLCHSIQPGRLLLMQLKWLPV